jgi:hypothetical protein
MPTTYPPAAPTIAADVVTINRFLQNPTLVARRLRTILQQRYIADAILTGRFRVNGGAIQYETGETIFTADDPRAVAPGGEYPLTSVGSGTASIAKSVKWGQDALVTDEAVKRLQMDPVNRALLKLANQNVKFVDAIALSAIASAVTNATAAAAAWAGATAEQMLLDVELAAANIVAQNQGYDPNTVVLDDIRYARAMAKFMAAGYLPRENVAQNPILTGDFPEVGGRIWMRTPNIPIANTVLVLDRDQLGGMADEELGGPGYVSAAGPGTAPVEVKSIRDDENDQYRLRARRTPVPVVVEPAAAWKITGA